MGEKAMVGRTGRLWGAGKERCKCAPWKESKQELQASEQCVLLPINRNGGDGDGTVREQTQVKLIKRKGDKASIN